MVLSDLGVLIWSNERCGIVIKKHKAKLSLYVVPKIKGEFHAPLGFILGGNALDFVYRYDEQGNKIAL